MEPHETRRLLWSDERRVTMAESDFAGLIYYSRPLEWQEALMGDWLSSIGHPMTGFVTSGHAFPVVHSEVDYRGPIGLDDRIHRRLYARRVGTASFTIGITCSPVTAPDHVLVETAATHVWCRIARDHVGERPSPRPEPLPDWLAAALRGTGADARSTP